jgi:hypothetical protein
MGKAISIFVGSLLRLRRGPCSPFSWPQHIVSHRKDDFIFHKIAVMTSPFLIVLQGSSNFFLHTLLCHVV